jgi:hypothetical protein
MIQFSTIEQFLDTNDFQIIRVWESDGKIFIIEIASRIRAIPIMIIVGAGVTIYTQDYPRFQINYSAVTQTDDNPTELELQHQYSDTDIPIVAHDKERLNQMYKQSVIIKNNRHTVQDQLRSIQNQLQRLKFSIQGLPYKLAIVQDNCLGILNPQDDVFTYTIKNHLKNSRTLYVVVQLDSIYDNIKTMDIETEQIINGIHKMLTKNQQSHINSLKTLIQEKETILHQTAQEITDRNDLLVLQQEYQNSMSLLNRKIKELNHELKNLKEFSSASLHLDMKRNHQIQQIEGNIERLKSAQNKLLKTLKEIQVNVFHQSLLLDDKMFTSMIMIKRIFNNFDLTL